MFGQVVVGGSQGQPGLDADAFAGLLPGSRASLFGADDLGELVVLQRCCWVPQALVNQTLDVPALTESHDEVLAWTRTWTTVVVRTGGGRLVAAGRGRLENQTDRAADWQLGRLMVAPDLAGRGVGSVFIGVLEALAPAQVNRYVLFTGGRSTANIALYQRAGYRLAPPPEPFPPGHIAGAVMLTKPRFSPDA